MGKNLTGIYKSYANKKSKYRNVIDVSDLPTGRGLSKYSEKQVQGFIDTIDERLAKINRGVKRNRSINTKSKNSNYNKFLKQAKLKDTTQARQIYKDIQEFTKTASYFKKHMGEIQLGLGDDERKNILGIIKDKTNVRDYLKNVPDFMLKYSPHEKTQDLLHRADFSYIDEILIRKNLGLKEEDYKKFYKSFNRMSLSNRLVMNSKIYERYFQIYEEMKQMGQEFNSYKTLKEIQKEVLRGDFNG